MSDLKSITGGTETLYLNLTPSEAGEVSNETEMPGYRRPTNRSQAAAVVAELEELQQKSQFRKRRRDSSPKTQPYCGIRRKRMNRRNNKVISNQPLNSEATKTAGKSNP